MVIMAKTYCHEGYCEPTQIAESNEDNIAVIGGYILFVITLTIILWYGASVGIYPDLTIMS